MAQNIQPPSFISETKTYAEYKQDLKRWSRISTLDKKLQAEIVIYYLDGHPSRIKEKIVTKIGDDLIGKEDGIDLLLKFLDTIYGKDDMADVWDKYKLFSNYQRKQNEDIVNFLPNWEMCYQKLKATGCEYSDLVLGLKLLEDAQLSDMDTKLVLTGVDFTTAKSQKSLQAQITNSLKKFTGRSVIATSKQDLAVSIKTEPTFLISQMEEVFVAKGWKPPNKGGRRRSRSESPPQTRKSNYKGKKNQLGEDSKPKKCFICKCDHVEKCNCPCVYHLANTCPSRKPRGAEKKKPDLGLFINSNIPTFYMGDDEESVFVLNETLDSLAKLSSTYQDAVVDSACPTTVAGEKWIHDFISKLSDELKLLVRPVQSDRVFKF